MRPADCIPEASELERIHLLKSLLQLVVHAVGGPEGWDTDRVDEVNHVPRNVEYEMEFRTVVVFGKVERDKSTRGTVPDFGYL
jgi:hypothetical protein